MKQTKSPPLPTYFDPRLRQQGLLFRCGGSSVQGLLVGPDRLWVSTSGALFGFNADLRPALQIVSPHRSATLWGDRLVLAGTCLQVWDAEGRPGAMYEEVHGYVRQVAGSPDGQFLVSLEEDDQLRVFGPELQLLRQVALPLETHAFAIDWATMQCSTGNQLWDLRAGLKLRDLHNGQFLQILGRPPEWPSLSAEGRISVPGEFPPELTAIADTPWGLAVGSYSGQVSVAGITWEAHEEPVQALAAFQGRLVTAEAHGVRLWSEPFGEDFVALEGLGEYLVCQTLSPDGRWLAAASLAGRIVVHRLEDGKQVKAFEAHEEGIHCLTYAPDSRVLASGCLDGTVGLWDGKNGQSIGLLDGHDGAITSLAFSPGGQWLASGASDGQVVLWEMENQQALSVFTGLDAPPEDLRFSSTQEQLCVLYGDGALLTWDLTRYLL